MPVQPPEWHTAQVSAWLAGLPGTAEWITGYASLELRVLALRLCASNTTWELLGVNFALVDWHALAAELDPNLAPPPESGSRRRIKFGRA